MAAALVVGVVGLLTAACSSSETESRDASPAPSESLAQGVYSLGVGDADSFGDGTFTVGEEIAAGRYEVTVSQECTLTVKETGGELDIGDGTFSGDTDISVANYADSTVYTIMSGTPVFNLKAGWVVTSDGCGTWTVEK
jgi:hypothetical protein